MADLTRVSHADEPATSASLRVLLLAPLRGRDPASGDTSYSEALLAAPPERVRLTAYDEALGDGRVVIRGRRARHGDRSRLDAVLLAARWFERLLRSRAMFREPTWFISCAPDAFDLIHAHLFSVRQVGPVQIPVVSSAGFPLPLLYEHRERWSKPRLRLAEVLERTWSWLVGAHNPWCRRSRTGVMTVYSEHFRQLLIGDGVPPENVFVASTALSPITGPRLGGRDGPPTIAFVGRDFERKGGPVAFEAFRALGARHPDWRFVVVTSELSPSAQAEPSNIEILTNVGREELVRRVLPTIDVLVLPTKLDCGAPYTVLEALQAGACVVLAPSPWLDERLTGPAVEYVPPIPTEVAAAVERLIDGAPRADREACARELWANSFDMESLHSDLIPAYERALALVGTER